MALISSISAHLVCPHGHATSGSRIRMETKLLGTGPEELFRPVIEVGHTYQGLEDADFDNAYWRLRWPEPGEPIRVLEAWWCPVCKANGVDSRFWALLVFEGERFASIETTQLTIGFLRTVHFLSGEVIDFFEWKLGLETMETLRSDLNHYDPKIVDHLVPHLPA